MKIREITSNWISREQRSTRIALIATSVGALALYLCCRQGWGEHGASDAALLVALVGVMFLLICLYALSEVMLTSRDVPDELLLAIAEANEVPDEIKEKLALRLHEVGAIGFFDLMDLDKDHEAMEWRQRVSGRPGFQRVMQFSRKE